MEHPRATSKLLIRLSSLGDVILASSALEALSPGEKVDWVTAPAYGELLKGHPKVSTIYEYNRGSGLRGWLKFSRQLWQNHYSEVLDLHGSLRTRIMRALFFYWSLKETQYKSKWRTISKQRFRLYGYFILKKIWPKSMRPTPWVTRFTRFAGGTGSERPNLKHLVSDALIPLHFKEELQKRKTPYLCVMPSSMWDGKKWPAHNYAQVLKSLSVFPVILGSNQDGESKVLCELLEQAKVPHYSGVGKWNLSETASLLAGSCGYLGNDTGLAHLAEAVGVPAQILFGPTTPEMGFGPWQPESLSLERSLACRPCGKDGRYCIRVWNRYACLRELAPTQVLENLKAHEPQSQRLPQKSL